MLKRRRTSVLNAAFCCLVDFVSSVESERKLVGAVGIENSTILPKPHKRTALQPLLSTQSLQNTTGSAVLGEFRAQTAFSAKLRINPHTLAVQALQGAQIAAQTRSNRPI